MYNELISKIREYNNIVIARHVGVDPDALCSQLALRESIKLTYPDKKVIAVGTGSSKFLRVGHLDKLEKLDNALLIVCDTPDKRRIDSVNPDDYTCCIKIDHHPFVEKFGDVEIIDDKKTSACEIIMNIIKDTELRCDSNISELLYLGLASDSNRFLFNSATWETFDIVSFYLKEYPFDLAKAYEKIYLRPLSEVRLQGYIASNMIITDSSLGYVVISDEIINKYGVDTASAGNMVNNFNYIKEALVWATITEDVKNENYRVSVRSRGPVINTVCERHNGGGHKYASGARLKTLDEAMNLIRDLNLETKNYIESISEEI